jgi:hypothetical protein
LLPTVNAAPAAMNETLVLKVFAPVDEDEK